MDTVYVIGIDPGKTGGIVVINEKAEVLECHEMFSDPIITIIFLSMYQRTNVYAYVEKAQAMGRGEGQASMQTYMREYGRLLGIMQSLGIPFKEITPQSWKKAYGLIEKRDPSIPKPTTKKEIQAERTERKKRAKQKAADIATERLGINVYTDRGRLMDGVADAALIALYGLQKEVESDGSD